jgi:hypothetical protein
MLYHNIPQIVRPFTRTHREETITFITNYY